MSIPGQINSFGQLLMQLQLTLSMPIGLICSGGSTFHHSRTLLMCKTGSKISQMQRNADSVFCLQSPKELWYVSSVVL